ncbi:MAG: methyltransferase domain-containing protein [Planctomycetota bacterium]
MSAPGAPTLDRTTSAVRDFYEQYPYPPGAPTLRCGSDARLVLASGRLSRDGTAPIQVLDAGCGRALGLIGEASVQRDVRFLGVDVNRRALEEARAEVARRKLDNVRLAEVDLMTLDGLEVPDGGFDVVRSSGVVHHLVDPARGLAGLARVLAPHGVIDLMVYGRQGREPIHRVARIVAAAVDDELPLAERVAHARALCRALVDRDDADCPFASALRAPDAEFVDRYLHPNERAYTIVELIELAGSAGLVPLAFKDPVLWSAENWIDDEERLAELARRDAADRLRAIEEIALPSKLELLLCLPGNGPRPEPARGPENELLLANPDVAFRVTTRNVADGTRVEEVAVCLRGGEPTTLPLGPVGLAAWLVSSWSEPFLGEHLVASLEERGVARDAAREALRELLAREVLFRPHPVDARRG